MKNLNESIKTDQREQDVLTLCKAVLNLSPNFWDNPNGGYENTCPFCYEIAYGFTDVGMKDISHKPFCAYLIAKDLSTNL